MDKIVELQDFSDILNGELTLLGASVQEDMGILDYTAKWNKTLGDYVHDLQLQTIKIGKTTDEEDRKKQQKLLTTKLNHVNIENGISDLNKTLTSLAKSYLSKVESISRILNHPTIRS